MVDDFKLPKDTPPMERELLYFLYDLSVMWGWCIPPDSSDRISKSESYTAKAFAKDVVKAEGLDADYEIKYVRNIANKFIERFGTSFIDSATFVDRVRGEKENW